MGHGFYQFGPELYYRAFSEENGFQVERLELQESRYFSVDLSCFGNSTFVRRRTRPLRRLAPNGIDGRSRSVEQ
jgi:hypothetical protein